MAPFWSKHCSSLIHTQSPRQRPPTHHLFHFFSYHSSHPPSFVCILTLFMHDILLGISLPPCSFFSTSFLFTAVIANLPSISLLASSPPLHSLLSPCLAHFRSHSDGRIHTFLDSEDQISSPFPLSILSFIIPSPPLCLFYMN